MNKPLGTMFCLMLAVTAMSVQSSAKPTEADLQAGQTGAQQSPVAQGPLPAVASAKVGASSSAVLSKYCITCHNEKRKTAGLAIDTLDLQRVGADAEVWEKIARKFRTHEMPPPGAPRPDGATYAAVTAHLENALDSAAAANPNAGRVPVHRLNRARVRQRHSGSSRARHRQPRRLTGRRLRSGRVRQRGERADGVACAARKLPGGRAHDQPAGSRRYVAQAHGRCLQGRARYGAGRADERRAAVRIARRHRRHVSVPRRRRVSLQNRTEAAALRLHRRHGRAPSARRAARRRAAEALHGRRRRQGDDDPGELRGQHPRRSRVGEIHADGGSRPRSARAGESGPAPRRRVLREAVVGRGRDTAAAANGLRPHDQRVVLRISRAENRVDRRSVQRDRPRRIADPPRAVRLHAERRCCRRTLREENPFKCWLSRIPASDHRGRDAGSPRLLSRRPHGREDLRRRHPARPRARAGRAELHLQGESPLGPRPQPCVEAVVLFVEQHS